MATNLLAPKVCCGILWLATKHSLNPRRAHIEQWTKAHVGVSNFLEKKEQRNRDSTGLAVVFFYILPPSQIISHSKNLGESKFFKLNQIYIAK